MPKIFELSEIPHQSVLVNETVSILSPLKPGLYIDATVGFGGHAEALLLANSAVTLRGIDQDQTALDFAARRLQSFGDRITLEHANFSSIRELAEDDSLNGVIADLGVSSLQLDAEDRGFSFRFEAPLDMRMDQTADIPTAADLLAELDEFEIASIIYGFGDERFSRRIARRIVERRAQGDPVKTTRQLVEIVERSVPRRPKDKIHPATKTFQALRIAVNGEIEILEGFIRDAIETLREDGRLAIITFHSLEDRIVKHTFQKLAGKCSCPPRQPVCTCGAIESVEILTKKPITPSEIEIEANPRSRSSKLRAVRKLKIHPKK